LGFYPVTAQIVTIAMLELESEKAFVYYQVPGQRLENKTEKSAQCFSVCDEKQLLELFWSKIWPKYVGKIQLGVGHLPN